MKMRKVIPIPISNSGNDYCPIVILSYLSKAFERVIHNQIFKYLEDHNLRTSKQSGFRSKTSCVTALVDATEDKRPILIMVWLLVSPFWTTPRFDFREISN